MCSIEYAKAGADDILIRIDSDNRGPKPPLAPAADGLVSQHLVLGLDERQTEASSRRVGRGRRSNSITTTTATAGSTAKAARASLYRERNQSNRLSSMYENRIALREGRHKRFRRPRCQDGGQPECYGTKAAAH